MKLFKKKEKEMKIRVFDENFEVYEFEFKNGYMIKKHFKTGAVMEKYNLKNVKKIYEDTEIENKIVQKSVVGRAIVGGILAGGVGAIVGGMTGTGTKNKVRLVKVVKMLIRKKEGYIIETYQPEVFTKYMKIDEINEKINEMNGVK